MDTREVVHVSIAVMTAGAVLAGILGYRKVVRWPAAASIILILAGFIIMEASYLYQQQWLIVLGGLIVLSAIPFIIWKRGAGRPHGSR
jgi:hypothetical protein